MCLRRAASGISEAETVGTETVSSNARPLQTAARAKTICRGSIAIAGTLCSQAQAGQGEQNMGNLHAELGLQGGRYRIRRPECKHL